ncbi:MAG: hypothetical protein ACPG7W_07995, partial [Paracoccaceae bacterium]
MQARAFDMRRRALIWSLLRNFLVAVCMVGLGVGAIHVINAPPHPIEGARFVDHVELCVDAQCDATTPTALPLRIPRDAALALRQVTVRLDLGSAFNGGMAGANAASAPDMRLMLPSVRRRLHVIEDGVTTFAPGAPGRPQWGEYNANNAPALVPLRSTTQDLRLTFDYIGQEGFVLFPMHIGPRHRVENTYKVRFALTRGLGAVSLVLMVLLLVMSIAMTV